MKIVKRYIKVDLIRQAIYKVLYINSKYAKRLKKFKNIHKNERCFIIGNGPSLKIEDLERLKDEITFGTNRIFNIFNETDWRPTYYCIQDFSLMNQISREIDNIKAKEKFLSINAKWKYRLRFNENTNYFFLNTKRYYPNMPNFSKDIAHEICEGFTVTYGAMQIAMYMGFKEIYLLGVDFNYSVYKNNDGKIIKQEGVKDYFSNDNNDGLNAPNLENSYLAYKKAKEYSSEVGCKIFNSTRGGNLDIFERVNLDDLFINK